MNGEGKIGNINSKCTNILLCCVPQCMNHVFCVAINVCLFLGCCFFQSSLKSCTTLRCVKRENKSSQMD